MIKNAGIRSSDLKSRIRQLQFAMDLLIVVILNLVCVSTSVAAQEQAVKTEISKPVTVGSEQAAEVAAIRASADAFVAAFNKRDAKSIAAMWTPNGTYTDESGREFMGRQEVEEGYRKFFQESDKVQMQVMIDSVQILSETAAVEKGRAVLEPAPAGSPGFSKYTAIHVKVDGKWLMADVRDEWVVTGQAFLNIADLEWLIGTWAADEHGGKSDSVCRWIANKSFVERKYSVTNRDGSKSSGVQIVGWNPQGSHIQSWNFSSDGGHAVGIWTRTSAGWSAEISGMTGDGMPTYAINQLTRLDDKAYAWQSVQRTVGDTNLPDTNEIVFRRKQADQ